MVMTLPPFKLVSACAMPTVWVWHLHVATSMHFYKCIEGDVTHRSVFHGSQMPLPRTNLPYRVRLAGRCAWVLMLSWCFFFPRAILLLSKSQK